MTKTILVNKEHKIKDSYLKKVKFIDTLDIDNITTQVEEETYNAYLELKSYLETKNIFIGIESAYRSLEKQQMVYEELKSANGKDYADKFVAPVGASEHHTGLALDIALKINDKYNNKEERDLEETQFAYIHSQLANYGFILRYPEGKEHITGYPYEEWHIRYVGKFVAKIISENKLTLEEYLTDYYGLLVINKEPNMTSFDVVNEISHLFGIKRVGHTGTLDPLATGVMIVAIGKATKVVELLTATYKEYIASVKLGLKTNTLDITGTTVATKDIPSLENLPDVLKSFEKTYPQEVPIYSAVKVQGKKLYEYARNNQPVTLPKKEVTIKEIELLEKRPDGFTFRALVSKGCYIRSLINDIATSLNTYGTMDALIRTKQGHITLESAMTLSEIKMGSFKLYSIDELLDIKTIVVDEGITQKIKTGKILKNAWNITDKVLFKDQKGRILGIYETNKSDLIVWKNFV